MAPLPRMTNPVCLIMNSADNKLAVNEEAKTILSKISQPLVVVSIVGPYRSGKSYLINKLSGQPGGVFSVDPTIKANTKGIWMWCMPHPEKHGHTLVLLDTEGLGDPDKGDKENDRIILSLALLMSSAVIYNSSGVIDYYALEKLEECEGRHPDLSNGYNPSHVYDGLFSSVPRTSIAIRDSFRLSRLVSKQLSRPLSSPSSG
ncbi:PREDICTED: guanylate-binding protein 3-like [Nanorana parkeri]|uniref:guanylate-binding protein 3-like n=1 Tax=Nanorana parkeri TaxID=125878 RepID=UPI000854251D|nr:PREDICTED: guanylate-binding protein 3-like [Nanorana parkeri]